MFSSVCSGSKHGSVQPKVLRGVNLRAIQQQTGSTRQPRTLHQPCVCAGSHWFHIWKAQLDCGRGPRQRLVHWSCRRVHQEKEHRLPQPDGRFLGDRSVQRGHLLGSDLASCQAGAETETREDYCKTGLWQREGRFHQRWGFHNNSHVQWQICGEDFPIFLTWTVSRRENLQSTNSLSSENNS